jgi:hypothetical protein
MQYITINELITEIPKLFFAKEPMMILGRPAIGKTVVIEKKLKELAEWQLNKELGSKHGRDWKECYSIVDGSGTPEETLSMPYIDTMADEKDGDHLKIDNLPEIKKMQRFLDDPANKGLDYFFLIDEISSFNQGDQRTWMNFIQAGRTPNGVMFDKSRVFFILAGNPGPDIPGFEDSDSPTHPIEEAVITRCAVYILAEDYAGFMDWAKGVNEKGLSNIHPYLFSAFKQNPGLYFKKVDDDIRLATNRTIEKCSNYLYAVEEMQEMGMKAEWAQMTIKSFFGDECGATIIATMNQLDKLMTLEELFGDEKDAKLKKTAINKYNSLDPFQQYYLLLKATEDTSPIKFKVENNVRKLVELLSSDEISTPTETSSALAYRLQKAPAGSNASALKDFKHILGDDDKNILFTIRENQALMQTF